MSVISDKDNEEIVIVLNLVKQFPHISADDKQIILSSFLHEEPGRPFGENDDGTTRHATIVAKKFDRVEIAVEKEHRDFWVSYLNKLAANFERTCSDVSKYRALEKWDEKLRAVKR